MKTINLWDLSEIIIGSNVRYKDVESNLFTDSLVVDTWKEDNDTVHVFELESKVEIRVSITPFKEGD